MRPFRIAFLQVVEVMWIVSIVDRALRFVVPIGTVGRDVMTFSPRFLTEKRVTKTISRCTKHDRRGFLSGTCAGAKAQSLFNVYRCPSSLFVESIVEGQMIMDY